MKNNTFLVPIDGTDRADFAPIIGRCCHCGVLGCLPEPHLPNCPEWVGDKTPFIKYKIDDTPFNYYNNDN
jgi:hypothetical protein